MWWLDEPESPEEIAQQLNDFRSGMTAEQRQQLAEFLTAEEKPAQDDAAAQQRWQRAQQRGNATPEPSQHKPQGPAQSASERVAEAREYARTHRGEAGAYAAFLNAKFEEAIEQQGA
jgi:hypothetical protein